MSNIAAALGGKFNANDVEPSTGGGGALPAGVYDAEIAVTDLSDNKAGTGQTLKVEYTITGPTHANRKVWQYLNITHQKAQVEQIGRAQLSSLCRAVGIVELADSDELMGRSLRIRLKVRPAQGQYEESNDVVAHEPAGSTAPAQKPASKPSAPPAAASKAAPPWQKRAA